MRRSAEQVEPVACDGFFELVARHYGLTPEERAEIDAAWERDRPAARECFARMANEIRAGAS